MRRTAATYKTKDFYMGRTLDYEFSYGEQITITPRTYEFDIKTPGREEEPAQEYEEEPEYEYREDFSEELLAKIAASGCYLRLYSYREDDQALHPEGAW